MRRQLTSVFQRPSTAVAVLVVGAALSAGAALLVASQLEREAQLKFESAVSDAKIAVGARVNDYADVLRGVRGLFAAVDTVSRAEFARYLQNIDLVGRYGGIQVIHYSRRITEAGRPAFEAMVRGDTSIDSRGYPDFTIRPAGIRPQYVVAMYVEPMAGNERALGLDLGGDPVRRVALERTRDSGQVTASGTIALALDPKRHPGFAMRLALYQKGMPLATAAQRGEAFTGMVSASFVMIDLMRGVLSEPFLQKVHVRIHDTGFLGDPGGAAPPTAENMMFDSNRLRGKEPPLHGIWDSAVPILRSVSQLEVGGRRWNLYFSAVQGFDEALDRWMPWMVLAGGCTISLLLFALIRSLAATGSRALKLATRMTGSLRESETRLAEAQRMTQQLIEVLPNPIYFKDTTGRYLGVNKAWEQYFATPRDAFIGKTVQELYPGSPETADRLTAMDQQLWDRPGTQTYEAAIRTEDGKSHDAIYYKATFTRPDGSVAGLIGTIVDITERKQAEAALQESAGRYRTLVEWSPEPIVVHREGKLIYVNPAAIRLFGATSAQQLIGKPILDLVHQDFHQIARARLQTIAEQGVSTAMSEQRYLKLDGTPIDVEVQGTPIAFDGEPATHVSIRDITARKQAERALSDSEARYRSVIAAIAEGVLLRNKDRRIVTCNASAERILGRALDQMRGNLHFDSSWQTIREDGSAFPEEERPAHAAILTGKFQSDVVIGYRKLDNSVLWLSMSAQPLFDAPDSPPSGCVTTFADITVRKRTEQRRAMEHAVTQVLAEAETLAEAAPRIIRTICETLSWACGAHWQWDADAQELRTAHTWHIDAVEVAGFVTASGVGTNEAPAWHGKAPRTVTGGLVRRVWMNGAPVWFADVALESGFRRGPDAARAGLHSAFGFPVMAGTQPLGVMEFYNRKIEQPDEALLQVVQAIGSQIGQFTVRKQAEERVRHLAHFDELTELPNRSMFNLRLSHALARARRVDEPLAILFIDLDRFKNINDTLGHDAGDYVLKEVAQRLRGCLREADTVGRLGGDEFVVLIEGASRPEDVAEVAQKILAAVARPVLLESQEFHITASIGISTCPGDSDDIQGLMKNADIAMYRAKEQGKNQFQFYSAQINVHTLERVALESDLRHALERNEFLLHYQPKVDIGSNRIVGMEALVRWQQPGKALIPPAQFIPLAEETGLIVPIGEWVLKTACLRNKAWQDQGLPRLRVAVNLSPRQFAHESLLQDVARVLHESGLDPAWLELEITESMVMRDPEHAVTLLHGLKAMGIHLSIDDFGTGYSSLSYLKRFPLDSVKIDRSFIKDLPGDGDDAGITQAIIAMAHSLRLGVIAEGVETGEQLEFLRANGCDEMQGYHFSRPLPADQFLRLLQGIKT